MSTKLKPKKPKPHYKAGAPRLDVQNVLQLLADRCNRLDDLVKQGGLSRSDTDYCMAALNEAAGLKLLIEGAITADDYLVARAYVPKLAK